ncbi:MAG: hypothetical protein Q8O30_00375 [Candidatus Omnitrophota bacterium]|nr:hypothetical protein [Candidatus Omnitrophota bacterium]
MKKEFKKILLAVGAIFLLTQGAIYAESYVDTPNRTNYGRPIDAKTPLPELIKRLEGWQEAFTFKAYWIGYNDDMYSIAAHGEKAIPLLLDFIEKSKSEHDRYGAILTIHLIGIESHVAGRFHEEFKNEKARQALLSFLSKEDLQIQVLQLLMRDPWPSDVPQLLKILQGQTPNAWAFVKLLQRYEIDSAPVHQKLPKDLAEVKLRENLDWKNEEELFKKLVDAIKEVAGDRFIIEQGLLEKYLKSQESSGHFGKDFGLGGALDSLTGCSYVWLGNKLEYYYENGEIHLCSIETARQRWLDWYKRQPQVNQ